MQKQMTVATAILLTGGFALAGDARDATGDTKGVSFESMDTNENREISKDEYYGSIADMGTYSDFDWNSDGLIEENEFSEIDVDGDFDAWDANNDDYLDSGEFYDGVFDQYDADNNDIWDNNEWDDVGDVGVFDV